MKFTAIAAVAIIVATVVVRISATEPTVDAGECWISTNGHFLESSALDAAFGAWGPYVVYKNYHEDARTFFFNNAQLNVNPPDDACDDNYGASTEFLWTHDYPAWTLVITNVQTGAEEVYTGGEAGSDFPGVIEENDCACLEDGLCISLVDGNVAPPVDAAIRVPGDGTTCGPLVSGPLSMLQTGDTVTTNIWMGCGCGGPQPPADVMGDPHFIVGNNVYDWKQVGVYNHIEFDTHAVELRVEEYAGCDGEVSGEFIRSIAITNTDKAYTAACDGIYDAKNSTLVSTGFLNVKTPCASFDMMLTNGYLNIYRLSFFCDIKGGVFKTLIDHDRRNPDGWFEVKDGVFTQIMDKAPAVVPIIKEPVVIVIDI